MTTFEEQVLGRFGEALYDSEEVSGATSIRLLKILNDPGKIKVEALVELFKRQGDEKSDDQS